MPDPVQQDAQGAVSPVPREPVEGSEGLRSPGHPIGWLTLLVVLSAGAIWIVLGDRSPAPFARSGGEGAEAFQVMGTSIREAQDAMLDGRITAEGLVEAHLARIDAYDRSGPRINSIVTLNEAALEVARGLDARLERTGRLVGPLHGIPIVLKDNIDTAALPTSAGSRALRGTFPVRDAEVVERLVEAGAIILGKANLAEFAMEPRGTIGSALPGYTFNPYAANRSIGGSSGGPAAAVAASFAVAAIGTDTQGSIRGPSAHASLVGLRPSTGLVSTRGIVPLDPRYDVVGPIGRRVTDVAIVLDVLAEPARQGGIGSRDAFADHLLVGGLEGKRIGVLRQLSNPPGADEEVLEAFTAALSDLERGGAEIVDPVLIEGWPESLTPDFACQMFAFALDEYLASRGPDVTARSLYAIMVDSLYHPSVTGPLVAALEAQLHREATEAACDADRARQGQMTALILGLFDRFELDAMTYPTWTTPPGLLGDVMSISGSNGPAIAPQAGLPAISIPMGYTYGSLPAGIELVARPFHEATLIEIAYAYEQATLQRRPPPLTPPLVPDGER